MSNKVELQNFFKEHRAKILRSETNVKDIMRMKFAANGTINLALTQ